MNIMNRNRDSLVLTVTEIIVGIVLLINPLGFTKMILVAIGVLALISAGVNFIDYLHDHTHKDKAVSAALQAVVGLVLTLGSNWILATFSALFIIFGLLNIFAGIHKFNQAMLLRRNGLPSGMAFVGSIVTIGLGVLIFLNPFDAFMTVWQFIGISLIIEAVLDIIGMHVIGR